MPLGRGRGFRAGAKCDAVLLSLLTTTKADALLNPSPQCQLEVAQPAGSRCARMAQGGCNERRGPVVAVQPALGQGPERVVVGTAAFRRRAGLQRRAQRVAVLQ